MALGAAALVFWDQKLLLATCTGAGMMALIYAIQQSAWRKKWLPLYKSLQDFSRLYVNSTSRQLILSVGGGGLAILTTYLAIAIWSESSNHWLATGALLQGGGTLLVLLLLVGQILQRQVDRKEGQFSQHLADLTHRDPMKRLVAVKQLSRTLNKIALPQADQAAIADCFRLMLGQEPELIVQEAVFDGLQVLDRRKQLEEGYKPQPLPILGQQPALNQKPAKSRGKRRR